VGETEIRAGLMHVGWKGIGTAHFGENKKKHHFLALE
jgi:hypothetical protein